MTRGRENPACSITETGKRADSVRMLHSHHSPGTRLARFTAGASGFREAEEMTRDGLPPEKWSSLMYGLWPDGGLKNGRRRAAASVLGRQT